uniref:Uncharacterized protein n=1 Tax=Arundo donax TaxID=35708 RepID=A0A0A9SRX5_ARUDO
MSKKYDLLLCHNLKRVGKPLNIRTHFFL